ncbi:type II toxin-antitoxin system RelE/ParE family toxin [Nannocystaceae bacterium ST9]
MRYSTAAEAEIQDAVDWYATRRDDGALADRFLDELARTESSISERPHAWPEIEPGVRWVVMSRFPYAMIYRVASNEVQVLAVSHHSRRHGYWRDRESG